MDLKTITLGRPAPTKTIAPLAPVIDATNALKGTFGSTQKGMPSTGMSPIPPNRPKTIIQRSAGNLLSPVTPPVLKSDPRLTSEIRATPHPDIVVFPPHPVLPPVKE
jgi:hypothetical protein